MALISRNLMPVVTVHARFSKNSDLLCEAIRHAIGDGHDAANLIGHYQEIFPDDGRNKDGSIQSDSFPDQFAWDAYLRLAALDDMADHYPAHVKTAARQMNAWPMLRYRHTDSKARFESLAAKLELGAGYPLDTSKTARFRPDTPMVRYLDGVVCRLHCFRVNVQASKRWEDDESEAIKHAWREPGEPDLDNCTEAVLRSVLDLEPLTKGTASTWAKRGVVPYIMAVDAKTPETCTEPALKAIWNQHGKTGKLKSRSDFKSRLTPDVVKTLRGMARPD